MKIGVFALFTVAIGGSARVAKDGILHEMAKQTRQAIAEADVVIFLVDAGTGAQADRVHSGPQVFAVPVVAQYGDALAGKEPQKTKINVVLVSDIEMPGLTGIEVAARLRDLRVLVDGAAFDRGQLLDHLGRVRGPHRGLEVQ